VSCRVTPIRIGVPPNFNVLRIERVDDAWLIWIHYNKTITDGTLIRLYDSGRMERVIVEPDGMEDVMEIKP